MGSLLLSAAACAGGAALLGGRGFSWESSWPGPLGPLRLEGDWLSGVFLLTAGLVGLAASLAGARSPQAPRVAALTPTFLLGLFAVPLAADAFTLVAAWELMSLSPGLMILLDEKAASRRAALLYLVYSQISAVALLLGLLLAPDTPGAPLGAWAGGALPGGHAAASLLVLLAALIKGGVMPFHSWLPEAHPVAPGHVSALMSGAMVAMPAYLVIRLLEPNGMDSPVALTVALLGGLSAALGALHALHTRDLKRVLAMTTVAHVGAMFSLLGIGLLLADHQEAALAGAVASAVSAYALTHGLAKGALFLVAGEVHHATGETSLDRLGGLWRFSRPLAAVAAVGGVALAALPPLGGFPAELSLLATFLAALPLLGPMQGAAVLGVTFLLAVGAGAGLAAVAKVVLGTFHGPVRAPPPAHPIPRGAATAPALLLAVSAAVGVLPGLLWRHLPGGAESLSSLPTPLGEVGSLGILAGGAVVALVAAAVTRGKAPRSAEPWNCGSPPPGPRQAYTAQGLVMPFRILFAEILRPGSDLKLQDAPVAQFAPGKGHYADPTPQYIEPWVHQPLVRFLAPKIETLRRLHRGPVQAYLLVALLVLVLILLALPVIP